MKFNKQVGDRLTVEELREAITSFERGKYIENEKYYLGENPPIVNRRLKTTDAPNHKIPVSYARKIVNTVVGYMYKPGLIQYATDNEQYKQVLDDIFYANNEDVKTSRAGKHSTIQGVGYELHYTLGGPPEPRFAIIPAKDMLPIYNYAIEPELIAAIYFQREYGSVGSSRREDIQVFYPELVEYYTIEYTGTSAGMKISGNGSAVHLYQDVPVVVYDNNEERQGDFQHVKRLIDAYDILISDSLNEFDRFAMAYLVLKGLRTDEEMMQQVKEMRTFELDLDGIVEFLQKDINENFIKFMSEWIRSEIHKQTHVPDFAEDKVTSGEMSGAAIDRLFYDFEFIAATKEALFRDGLYRRLDLIDQILSYKNMLVGQKEDVKLIFNRNKPVDMLTNAQAIGAFSGFVSKQTLLENFAPFVENVADEIERLEEEEDVFAESTGFGETDMAADREDRE